MPIRYSLLRHILFMIRFMNQYIAVFRLFYQIIAGTGISAITYLPIIITISITTTAILLLLLLPYYDSVGGERVDDLDGLNRGELIVFGEVVEEGYTLWGSPSIGGYQMIAIHKPNGYIYKRSVHMV